MVRPIMNSINEQIYWLLEELVIVKKCILWSSPVNKIYVQSSSINIVKYDEL
jgi:hypothetical protein